MTVAWIPEPMLANLPLVPRDCAVSLVIRHSHRPPIPPGTYGDEIGLTPEGVAIAEELGGHLAGFPVVQVQSSPVGRCVETVHALSRGAGWSVPVVSSRVLGAPGPFVVVGQEAGPLFLEHGPVAINQRLFGGEVVPGCRSALDGTRMLLDLVVPQDVGVGLSVYCSHDAIIALAVATMLRVPVDATNWPKFLEGFFVYRCGEKLGVVWKGQRWEVGVAA